MSQETNSETTMWPVSDLTGLLGATTQEEADRRTYFEYLGDSHIAFGTALKNPKTTIAELAILAHQCGMVIRLAVEPCEA